MRSVSLSRVSAAAALSLATGFSSAQSPRPVLRLDTRFADAEVAAGLGHLQLGPDHGFFGYMGSGGGNSFSWAESGQGRMGTHPWADLRRFLANSPYYQADKIHTPLLLIHGSEDVPDNAQRMFNALKRLDRTAQLAVYDKEGHVPGTWSLVNAVDATQRMLEFLERYVLAGPGGKDEKSGVAPAK